MTVVELRNVKPLRCMRRWFKKHVADVFARIDRLEFECPECHGDEPDFCHFCGNTSYVSIESIRERNSMLAERIEINALRGIPEHYWLTEIPPFVLEESSC